MVPKASQAAVAVETTGSDTRIIVTGELDVGTIATLRVQLDEVIADGAGSIEVDVSGVTFCDSVALAVLVHAYVRMRQAQRRMRVVEPSHAVARVLELAGLDELVVDADDRSVR